MSEFGFHLRQAFLDQCSRRAMVVDFNDLKSMSDENDNFDIFYQREFGLAIGFQRSRSERAGGR
jgi:hypothetical protein